MQPGQPESLITYLNATVTGFGLVPPAWISSTLLATAYAFELPDESTTLEIVAEPQTAGLLSASTDSNTMGAGLAGNAGIGGHPWVVPSIAVSYRPASDAVSEFGTFPKVPQSCGALPVNPNSAFPLKPGSAA